MDKINWIICDSLSDMEARLSSIDSLVFDKLIIDDANAWGYLLHREKNICIPVSFSDVGLKPKIFIRDTTIFVGITDTVAGYNLIAGKLFFKYKVPTVFHEFVKLDKQGIIIQDETGFVGLSYDGTQRWMKLYNDMIDYYQVNGNVISGKTVDDQEFEFHTDTCLKESKPE